MKFAFGQRKNGSRAVERNHLLGELRTLLDVPDCAVPWGDLAYALRKLSLREIRALEYRIRIARRRAAEDGEIFGADRV